MAGSEPTADQDIAKEQLELLEEALETSLDESGDLAALARDANLAPEHLIEEGMREAPKIVEAASSEWEFLLEARDAERELQLHPIAKEGLLRYMTRCISLASNSLGTMLSSLAATFGLVSFLLGWAALAEGAPLRGSLALVLVGAGSIAAAPPLWRWGRRGGRIQRAVEKALASTDKYRTAVEAAAGGWVREQINAARAPSYATTLSFGDRSGLAEVDDPSREIPTRAKDRLLELMEDKRMPGGAIGLSGSRGAGKSTLMRAICRPAPKNGDRKEVLGVVVDAPVEYEAREFVLYLFAKVCSQVIGRGGVTELRHRSSPIPSLTSYLASRGILVAIAGLILFGMVQLYASLFAVSISITSGIWGFLLVTAGALLLSLARRLRRHRDATAPKTQPGGDVADVATAADHLQEIWFQQSFSTGWSGSFKLPAGLGGGITNTAELAKRQLSFPEVVDLFKEFLEQISSSRQVRIGIDELDKMDDAAARRFLNEIKVVFRVPGCFFLISISEDAMSSFERRGLPFRDEFDSSFDDVEQVRPLRLKDSKALLDRRIVGLPLPFVCLIHCTSGGLPRDLIRAARELVELQEGTELDEAAAKLVGEAIRSKADAMRIKARGFRSERHVTVFVDWLGRLLLAGANADDLLRLCRNFQSEVLGRLAELPDDEDLRSEHRDVQGLGMQLAAFAYLAATVLELFSRFADGSCIDSASGFDRDDADELAPVDRLAGVSQAFSADIDTAWELLSELRSELALQTVGFPSVSGRRVAPEQNGGLPGQAARLLRSMSGGWFA